MKTHFLKTWPRFFQEVRRGRKKFEFREEDRGFCEGDKLVLLEWERGGCPTGRAMAATAGFIASGDDEVCRELGIPRGYCIISLMAVRVASEEDLTS